MQPPTTGECPVSDDQEPVIAFLSTPSAYGLHELSVDRHETHGAIVFLAGEFAYKLKRAIALPYFDYSSPERRRIMCETELRINRKLAPELYLGVLPIVRSADGALHIAQEVTPRDAVDWLVVMHRFPQNSLLSAVAARGALTLELTHNLAERIAAFHMTADITDSFGGKAGIVRVIDECVELLRRMRDCPFDRGRIDKFESLARSELSNCTSLLEKRRATGSVRRCHGDLHLRNICLINNMPVLFDAIEFREDFSCIDVLYDLAFLLMDLEQSGLKMQANALMNAYLARTHDYEGLAALPLFLACRAALRAHIAITAAQLGKDGITSEISENAVGLLELSIAYLEKAPIRLIAVGGLSGSGKSTLASQLAPNVGRRPGAIHLKSDSLRKQLWGIEETLRLPQTAYTSDVTKRVYAAMAELSARILRTGYSVVADAVFGRRDLQRMIESVPDGLPVEFSGIWLEASVSQLEQRIRSRRNDVSDATVAVLHRQLATIETPVDWIILEAKDGEPEIFSAAISALKLGRAQDSG